MWTGLLRLEAAAPSSRAIHDGFAEEIEWCDRRLLARIHRLTLGELRKQIQPVTAAQFMHWLLRWQHVAPGTQFLGERGTLEVLQQLQGFEAPANAWEDRKLQRRVANYDGRRSISFVSQAPWDGAASRLTPRSRMGRKKRGAVLLPQAWRRLRSSSGKIRTGWFNPTLVRMTTMPEA